MNQLTVAAREAPAVVFDGRSWSVAQLLNQVRQGTSVGQRYVSMYAQQFGYVIV